MQSTTDSEKGAARRVSQLILTLNHDSMQLEVGGNIANHAIGCAILEMARLHLERNLNAELDEEYKKKPALFPAGLFGKSH